MEEARATFEWIRREEETCMQSLSAPRHMRSMPLGRHVLYKEVERDVSQRALSSIAATHRFEQFYPHNRFG